MKLLKNLFKSKAEVEVAETYHGFRIVAAPVKEGSKYRLAARVEMDIDGATKVHQVIRADTFDNLEDAKKFSVAKAKQVIDENGKALFKQRSP